MRKINFTKMSGAGNDFIVIEAQKSLNYKALALKACDRTNGIGADGLLVLDRSKKCDYKMRIINSDGSEAEMCGNGVRCLARYIFCNKKPKHQPFTIETLAGTIYAKIAGELAIVKLSDPNSYNNSIAVDMGERTINVGFINTGVPHTIVFVDDIESIDVKTIGRIIRYHKVFAPRGTNVNFVEQIKSNLVVARTYERGVEDETKACGTGSVASGIITYLKSNPGIQSKRKAAMNVKTKSGEILNITFDIIKGRIFNVWLKGSAKFIASGEFYL